MPIREETVADTEAVSELIRQAFLSAPMSSGTEAFIVECLRQAGALTLGLVATDAGRVIGHVAFSPVLISEADLGWFGLGPMAVAPDFRSRGHGAALIREGLERLRASGANGCVVLGNPDYYQRFGFRPDPAVILPGVPPEVFMALRFKGLAPAGSVRYHAAFQI